MSFNFEGPAYTMGFEAETHDYKSSFSCMASPDGSGPMELSTPVCNNLGEIIQYLKKYDFGISGHGVSDSPNSAKRRACGSHIHITVPKHERANFFDITRVMGLSYLSPFFAGTRPKHPNEDFRFRDEKSWIKFPNYMPEEELEKFYNNWDTDKRYSWAITPYRVRGWAPHFEIRLNEGHPVPALVAVKILAFISHIYTIENHKPVFSQLLINTAKNVITKTNSINTIKELSTVFSHSQRTCDILNEYLDLNLNAGDILSCRQLLRAFLKIRLLEPFEKEWVVKVIQGNTWSKLLSKINTSEETIALTMKYLKKVKLSKLLINNNYKYHLKVKNKKYVDIVSTNEKPYFYGSILIFNKKIYCFDQLKALYNRKKIIWSP